MSKREGNGGGKEGKAQVLAIAFAIGLRLMYVMDLAADWDSDKESEFAYQPALVRNLNFALGQVDSLGFGT